ncbi:hypothetical protein AMTRI_Chr03g51910 [Amborella trichopoda]|uniref:Uncharacterized protein n=1 Tax=Amborella trichopoda TaxID=13333 RepID=U5D544_AMBTC|nr:myosin-G heavy chain isoform X1 [Amborella trichopoda]ERN15483.1 hypothetical protein AMTR_s00048p00018580 [Amborella trichopoda]|eukprot:XP_020529076.1 myosin-G heavy chain isoform X1 [Amborella trichopoda]
MATVSSPLAPNNNNSNGNPNANGNGNGNSNSSNIKSESTASTTLRTNLPATTTTPRPNLRGLNKPKCSQCGNVARSRCPFQSCKSCCSRAQNPCYIHVLKGNVTLPDKVPSSSSPLPDHQRTDVSSSTASPKTSQRSNPQNYYTPFIGANIPVRSRKPLSRKEIAAINGWRFSKLKEHTDQDIEAENEAFERYMQNVSLLEEVFSIHPLEPGLDNQSEPAPTSLKKDYDTQKLLSCIKARIKADPQRGERNKQKLQGLIDARLGKLQSGDSIEEAGEKEPKRTKNGDDKAWFERPLITNGSMDSKARIEDELKACLAMKLQLSGEKPSFLKSENDEIVTGQESKVVNPRSFGVGKLYTEAQVTDDELCNINAKFSSCHDFEEL